MTKSNGQPLSRILTQEALPIITALKWAYATALRLQLIHENEQVYRDLKPSNIMIAEDDSVQLIDSGISELSKGFTLTSTGSNQDIHNTPILVGSPPYLSPEQIQNQSLDARSDIFSLGIVLYEMVTGRRPFSGPTVPELLNAIRQAKPVRPSVLNPKISTALEKLIQKALHFDPNQRFQNIAEFLEALEVFITPTETQSSLKLWHWLVPVFLVLLLGGIAFWYWLENASSLSEEDTLLVFPLEGYGDLQNSLYVGRSFAEAIAINLAQAPHLKILPVPQMNELTQSHGDTLTQNAQKLGAKKHLSGSLTREGQHISTNISLVDTLGNRIIWGIHLENQHGDLSTLSILAAEQILHKLGGRFPVRYDYIANIPEHSPLFKIPQTALALHALKKGEVEQLLKSTTIMARKFPQNLLAQGLHTLALVLQWDTNASLENLNTLEMSINHLDQLAKGNAYAAFFRAFLLFKDKQPLQAITQFSKLLKRTDLTPSMRAWILRYRASAKSEYKENTESALADLEYALKLDPTNAWTYRVLADTLLAAKKAEQALIRVKQAMVLMPTYWRHYHSLGLIYSELEDHTMAKDSFSKACELGQNQLPCSLYALSLLKNNLPQQARKIAQKTQSLIHDATGLYNLACFWALQKNKTKAIGLLKKSLIMGFSEVSPQKDPDLAILYNEAEFKALMAGELK